MRGDVYAGLPTIGFDSDARSVAEYLGDSAYLARCIDLDAFNVLDADAFANPWEVLWIASRRIKRPRTMAVFATDGGMGGPSNMHGTFRRKGWSRQMMDAIGVQPDDKPKGVVVGKGKPDIVAHRMISSFFDRWSVSRYLSAWGGGSGGTLYCGALLTAGSGDG